MITSIERVDYTSEEFEKLLNNFSLEPISNAIHFIDKFYASTELRMSQNPFDIHSSEMEKAFGETKLQDDYKNSKWWIFTFRLNMFAIDINENEGSQIYLISSADSRPNTRDKDFSDIMENFYNEIFSKLKKQK